MDLFKIFKPLFGIVMALLFVFIGCYLIQKDDKWTQIIGYGNVIFFGGLLIFAIFKLINNRSQKIDK